MEVDTKYPWDPQGRRNVQLYFTPTAGTYAKAQLNLNRMLVRSGYAVVDLNQATQVDLQQWLNDEVYARDRKTPAGVPDPLGLWKMGVLLGQRPPPAAPGAVVLPGAHGSAASPAAAPSGPIGGTSSPSVAPPAIGATPPGVLPGSKP